VTFSTNANGGLILGETFTVSAESSKAGAIQTLVLADGVSDNVLAGLTSAGDSNETPDLFQVELFSVQNSVEVPDEQRDPLVAPGAFNWVATTSDLTVNEDITLQDPSWVDGLGVMPYLPVEEMDMFVEYRALLSQFTNTIYSISDIGDIVTELGTIDPDNPLAVGIQKALENSAATNVYYMAVPTDDLAGYLTVLDRATLVDTVYAFNPLTRDIDIQDAVEAHVNAMSTPSEKKWRIAFFGRDLPTEKAILTSATHPTNADWLATVEDDPRFVGTQITKMVFTENADLLSDAKVGDIVHLSFTTDAWGNEVFETNVINEIESDTILYLQNPLASAIVVAAKTEVYHPYDTQETATAVADISRGYNNRRVYHCFPSSLGDNGTFLGAEFGCSAIAGLVSSVVPQQGLTNLEVNGFDDLPLIYSTFSQAQLDEIAGAGTLIIAQELVGGPIFVRHQISTAAEDSGYDLNETELSLVKNLDSISYFFAGQLAPFIGKFNITPQLLDSMRTQIESGMNFLGGFTSVGLLGPQIILDGSSIESLEQHPTLLDRVVIRLNLQLPPPLNVIELHLQV
jgi:hypothetical protein